MKGHGEFMLLLYAQQMKNRKLSVGEALDMLTEYRCTLGNHINVKA